MTRQVHWSVAAVLASAVGFSAAGGAAAAEQWSALSTTAMGITGDVGFDGKSLIFDEKTRMKLGKGTKTSKFAVDGKPRQATVYPVEPPMNPKLESGNTLCGDDPIKFVAIFGDYSDPTSKTGRTLELFDAGKLPTSDADSCAMFTYVLAK
ncbi:hypothetical protein [Mangrovicella endophytica]|uniref:hypothetical protein n=1 Tax=Mangrovicella endophytica TaxID=2066697 RepID=UPI0012FFEE21|nr:hypothetical protein [Mangrovicella endophytica]